MAVTKDKLAGVQVCRGLAALLVLLFHDALTYFPIYSGTYANGRQGGPTPFDFGHAGVDFFFVLSGFIILHAHQADLGRPDRLPRYGWRRFVRIYPTYWVVLALMLPVYLLVPGMGGGYEGNLDVIVKSMLLWPQAHLPIVTVAWTLSHEMLFYLVFALIIWHRRAGLILLAGWAGLILLNLAVKAPFPWSFVAHPHNLQFFMGMAAALALGRTRVPAPRLIALCGLLMFVGTGMAEVYSSLPVHSFGFVTYGLGSMLILLGVVEAERQGRLSAPGWAVLLGEASYSIYLVHNATLSASARALKALGLPALVGGWPAFILLALIATMAGVAFHLMIEKPLMRLASRPARPVTP